MLFVLNSMRHDVYDGRLDRRLQHTSWSGLALVESFHAFIERAHGSTLVIAMLDARQIARPVALRVGGDQHGGPDWPPHCPIPANGIDIRCGARRNHDLVVFN